MSIILCHKDGGVLAGDDVAGLYGCGCISGYVRGFEPLLTREQAIIEQVKATKEWIALFVAQGRDAAEVKPLRTRLAKLEALK